MIVPTLLLRRRTNFVQENILNAIMLFSSGTIHLMLSLYSAKTRDSKLMRIFKVCFNIACMRLYCCKKKRKERKRNEKETRDFESDLNTRTTSTLDG